MANARRLFGTASIVVMNRLPYISPRPANRITRLFIRFLQPRHDSAIAEAARMWIGIEAGRNCEKMVVVAKTGFPKHPELTARSTQSGGRWLATKPTRTADSCKAAKDAANGLHTRLHDGIL